ncbi:hypothetical protein Tco_0957599 [Tanacetum coccineum]
MSIANQQTLAKLGASDRPSILEKQSYVPWASRFLMFVENKKEERELMRDLIFEDIRVINYILQGIPSDIHNSVDACPDAKQMWARIKMLMQGSDISQQERHSRLMNEFDKFVAVEGESLTPVYKRFSTLLNVMDQNNLRPQEIANNTKFLNSLQPEWSKYVTMTRDAQEDKITTAMMLLARAITQHYSTPTNNRLRTSSNTRNQAVIQDGRVDIQSKNVGYIGDGNRNVGQTNRNQATNAGNGLVQSIEEYDQNVQRNPRTESTPGKQTEQIVLATKDEVEMLLDEEENDFLLDNAYGDNTLEELNAAVNASQIDMINGLLSKSDHE